ncbi:unnamed protein product [Lymnaea stagnalis]|uniref:G-protein coupled receptors family 1 profile domain-containing protein n=1 Tax=Lymnaea stagnalis TaxID=6523 RepID=A0AAV2IEY8_LYMST
MEQEALPDFGAADRLTACNLTRPSTNCSENSTLNMLAFYDTTPEAVIVPCVFALILIVGVTGNVLLILSFARHKTLTTPHNALVVNLASGDFIFLIVSLPFNSVWYTLPYWPFGLVICKLSHFAESLATAVVIITLSVLSIERCLIVTGKKLWRQQKRGPILLTVTIWALSAAVSLPNLLSSNLEHLRRVNKDPICDLYDTNWGAVYPKIHVVCRFILLFCLPLLVIATAYTIIAVHLLLRAFPLSDRRATSQKIKTKPEPKCLAKKDSTAKTNSENCKPTLPAGSKVSQSAEGTSKEPTDAKENLILKSKSPAKTADKVSLSTKSSKDSTDTQQTPVLNNSFCYTGPIPSTEIQPFQRKPSSKADSSSNETPAQARPLSDSPATRSLQETTPLNPGVRLEPSKLSHPVPTRQETMVTKRRRLALTVLMLILAFAVCWTPRHVYFLWYHLHPGGTFDYFWHIFKMIGFCLSFSNSAVNPVVFYVLDSKYRSFVHKALCAVCMKRCGRPRGPQTEALITMGERDYNATIALTDMASNENVTHL